MYFNQVPVCLFFSFFLFFLLLVDLLFLNKSESISQRNSRESIACSVRSEKDTWNHCSVHHACVRQFFNLKFEFRNVVRAWPVILIRSAIFVTSRACNSRVTSYNVLS